MSRQLKKASMWFTICHWIWSALEERLLKPHEDNDLEHGMQPPAWAEVRKVIAKTVCLPLCRKKKSQKQGVSVVSVSRWLCHLKKCETTPGFSGWRWSPPSSPLPLSPQDPVTPSFVIRGGVETAMTWNPDLEPSTRKSTRQLEQKVQTT